MERKAKTVGTFPVTAVLIGLLILPACYTFRPVDLADLRPGEEVQLVLSGPATRGIAPTAMMGETLVQGDLEGVSDDSVSVSVWIGQAYRGTPFEPVRQAYSFPRIELVRVERRSLSKPRTALTTLGILAGIYVLIDRVIFLEDPNPGDPDQPHKDILQRCPQRQLLLQLEPRRVCQGVKDKEEEGAPEHAADHPVVQRPRHFADAQPDDRGIEARLALVSVPVE